MSPEKLAWFINERWHIALNKKEGHPPPWTKDPMLQQYRFTNVYREWDPVTIFINQWLKRRQVGELITWAVFARYINEPMTLEYVGEHVLQWVQVYVFNALVNWKGMGRRVFNPAYIVSTNGQKMDKLMYVVKLVDDTATAVDFRYVQTLDEAYEELTSVKGVGSFMAGQIIADLKHTPLLNSAKDWWTWCTPGPGSMRGLNRVLSMRLHGTWTQRNFQVELAKLHERIAPLLDLPARLDMQNLQNCLCEYDKWCRATSGEGRPKQLYTPTAYREGN